MKLRQSITDAIPPLNRDEVYCVFCKQIIKKQNLHRHDYSVKHDKAVMQIVGKIVKNYRP